MGTEVLRSTSLFVWIHFIIFMFVKGTAILQGILSFLHIIEKVVSLILELNKC